MPPPPGRFRARSGCSTASPWPLILLAASALVLLPRTIPAQSSPPLDFIRCDSCGNRHDTAYDPAFRSGTFWSLGWEIIDPACDCPFPNNQIPQSRLLPNGAWPEDIYLRNRGRTSFSDGSRAVAEGWTMLHLVMRSGSSAHPTRDLNPAAVEALLAFYDDFYDVNARIANGSVKGATPLMLAALHGRSAGMVGWLLAAGAEVDAPDDRGYTPLLRAARPEVFDLLVAAGADIRARSNDGFTALHRAALYRPAASSSALPAAQVQALLAAGLDPNAQTDSGSTPLLNARSAEAFDLLVAAGADIRARSNSGYTALHRAASSLPAAQVEALLAAGLDPNAETDRGLTALHFAGSAEAFEALVAAGADIAALEAHFDRDLEEVRAAATRSYADWLRNLYTVRVIGRYASPSSVARLSAANPQFVNWPDSLTGSSPRFVLHLAAESGEDPALIDALVAAGAVVDPQSTSRSPLALAAANPSARAPEIVNALLAAGAEVNPGYSFDSPLHLAAGNPSAQAVEIVNALLAAGADPNPQDSRRVPVYAAAMAKNSEAVEALVAAGARVENVGASTHYYTLLADVLSRRRFDCGYAPVAAALQAAGAVSLASDPGGGGSLPFVPGPQVAACSFLSPRIARLIDSGADLEARDASGQTELHRAASGENLADVEALIDAGADVNATSLGLRLTPLQLAAARGAGPSILQALLDGGAEVGARDIRGWTALHRAARESRDPAVFETLVAGGADVNAKDSRGLTPLDHARLPEIRNEAAIAVLEAAGQP